jgi:uncharacterized protein YggE
MTRLVRVGAYALVVAAVMALPAAAATGDPMQGITVTGVGSMEAAPDVSAWSFGVSNRANSARQALARNAVTMKRIATAVKAAGVAEADVQTQSASLYPRRNRRTGAVSYTASGSVTVTVRSLGKVGAVVEAATGAGASEIFGPRLRISDQKALYDQALEKAYDDALAKAQKLAAKTGLSLGAPTAVVEGSGGGDVYDAQASAGLASESFDIEPGRNEVSAALTVTFAAT